MASLRVPDQHVEGIAKILSLTDESFEKLAEVLAGLPVKLYPRDLLVKAITGARGVQPDAVEVAADTILRLCINQAGSNTSTEDFVTQVIQSIGKFSAQKLPLSEQNTGTLRSRLTRILNVRSLAASAKATSVVIEYERSFSKARILSDIRPIFGTKADSPPDAAVIVHTLRIHYHQDGEHKDFFVAMDDRDVQDLLEALERAKAKSKALKETLASAKITCVEAS